MRKQDIKVGEWYAYREHTYRPPTALLVVALDDIIEVKKNRFQPTEIARTSAVTTDWTRKHNQTFVGVIVMDRDLDAQFDLWAEGSEPPQVVRDRQALVDTMAAAIPIDPHSVKLRNLSVRDDLQVVVFTSRQLLGPWVETHAAQVTERQREADRRAREQLAYDARKAAFAELSTLAARVGLRLGPTQTYGEGSFLHATVRVTELTALLTELAAQRADDSI